MKCLQAVVLSAAVISAAVIGVCGCTGRDVRPHHAVMISTEFAGAACLVTGGAEPIAELPATPAVLRPPQSPRDVRVFCTSPGHVPVAATLPAESEARQVAAAALLYGPAPAAVGLMMGAMCGYAPKLDVTLPPMRFATARDRDRLFAGRAAESRRHFDQPIQAHRSMCRPDEFGCQHMIAEMERARDEELARLEKLREATPTSQ